MSIWQKIKAAWLAQELADLRDHEVRLVRLEHRLNLKKTVPIREPKTFTSEDRQ